MYFYLIGCLILAIIWGTAFILRKDLRRPMVWSGIAYIVILTLGFILIKIVSFFVYIGSIIPDYWNPDTLFNLGRIIGGYALEDVLFMFFIGGIVTFAYEFFFKKKIKFKKTYRHHIRAPIIGFIIAGIFVLVFKVNLIYSLILFGFAGAISIWVERKDLIKHSLLGGLIFLIIYFLTFLFFNSIFPDYVHHFYNLEAISGILILSIPLEELLFAISFGLMWAPIYEYEHGEKDVDM